MLVAFITTWCIAFHDKHMNDMDLIFESRFDEDNRFPGMRVFLFYFSSEHLAEVVSGVLHFHLWFLIMSFLDHVAFKQRRVFFSFS